MSEWARWYAEHGGSVFPIWWPIDADPLGLDLKCACPLGANCSSPAKHPLVRQGVLEATRALPQVDDWWARWPDANIGIATGPASNYYVIDLDGSDGIQSWYALTSEQMDNVTTLVSTTGSGGEHWWFEVADDDALRNTCSKLGRGIDTRGKGGYVLAPPSRHVSGRSYEWKEPREAATPLPSWLRGLLTPRRDTPQGEPHLSGDSTPYGRAILRDALERVRAAPEGQRNSTLNAEAFNLGQWIGGGEISPLGVAEALLSVSPDPDTAKSEKTIRAGLHDGAQYPRTKDSG
jgi:hypothetical protein